MDGQSNGVDGQSRGEDRHYHRHKKAELCPASQHAHPVTQVLILQFNDLQIPALQRVLTYHPTVTKVCSFSFRSSELAANQLHFSKYVPNFLFQFVWLKLVVINSC